MPRIASDSRVRRYHVFLPEADIQHLKDLFGPTIGVSGAIRSIINSYLRQVERKTNGTPTISTRPEPAEEEDRAQL